MRRILRHPPAPGTALALIALFVALGGGAYAVSGPPGPNTVGKPEIVTGGVGKKEVDVGAVGRAEIRNDSIAGGKLCEQGDAGCKPITGANFDESTLTGVANAKEADTAKVAGTVIQVFRDAAFALPAGSGVQRTILTVPVPAGSYLIHGGTTVRNDEAAARDEDCFLRAGADFDQAQHALEAGAADANIARFDMQLVHTFPTAGTITMTCEGGTAAGDVDVYDRKVQAHQVAAITSTAATGP